MSVWVVVGAGSAGCVVAARLSEDPATTVVLLEAGPSHDADVQPIGSPDFFEALALPGRTYADVAARRTVGGASLPYLRGRGLGGSSAVNAMVALHGDPELYESWGWTDAEAAWQRILIPTELADDDELGPLDRALLAADPDARKVPLTRRDGRRVSAADAYLVPALDRPNLLVHSEVLVDRVLIDDRRATGVRLADGMVIEADHVVVAAGSIHSPALLMRSGVDTPGLGDGLQDHPSVAFTLRVADGLTRPGLATGVLLERDGLQVLPLNHLGSAESAGYAGVLAAVMRPHGRAGTVRLASDDPAVPPVVEFNLLADPRDLDEIVSAANLTLDVLRREPFRSIASEVYIDDHGTTWRALGDPERLVAWVGSSAGTYVHASSTCAMGRVVDDRGAVFGYDGLFVCDASVFPSIPDANTHLPTTMLAERLVARWRSSTVGAGARG